MQIAITTDYGIINPLCRRDGIGGSDHELPHQRFKSGGIVLVSPTLYLHLSLSHGLVGLELDVQLLHSYTKDKNILKVQWLYLLK